MATTQPRPLQVKYALILMWASILTGIAESFLHIANGVNATQALQSDAITKPIALALVVMVSFALVALLHMRIKWAQMALVTLAVIGVPMSIYSALRGEGLGEEFPLQEMFFGSISTTLIFLAAVLLCSPASRQWFYQRETTTTEAA